MTASSLAKFKEDLLVPESTLKNDSLNSTSQNRTNSIDEEKVLIAMGLSFFTGLIQVLFAILHLGFITKYLSDGIVNGFTVGAATFVIVSQIPSLLGVKIAEQTTPFIIIEVKIFKNF